MYEPGILYEMSIDQNNGLNIWNLGTGKGYSVLEIIRSFEKIGNLKIPFSIDDQRI